MVMLSRRCFMGGAFGFAAVPPLLAGAKPAGDGAKPPARILPRWRKGEFQIHFIHTGVGESQFLIFPDGTTMLLDCPGNPAVNLGRVGVPILPSARLHAGEWIARYVKRVNPHGTDVDYMAISHFHQDHGGGVSYHKGVAKWKGGEYYRSGFALAAEQLKFRKAIDRTGPTFDDFMKDYSAPGATMKNLEQLYRHLMERDGLVLEKFRLGATDQVVPLHGACDGFSVANICGNGCVAKPDGGTVDMFNGNYETLKKKGGFFENCLSVGYIFRYGDFSYGKFGDFNGRASDGRHIEKTAAPFMPHVTVAKMNHHGNGASHPREWVRALSPKVWVSCVWSQAHSEPGTLTKLTDETAYPGERLICPTVFPASRRCKAILRKLPWLDKIEPSAFLGGHVVVTVPPGGKTFKVAYVDAGDEKMAVLSERAMVS